MEADGSKKGMVKGILFDKDGTLIDFFSLWLQAATEVVPVFLRENHIEDSRQMEEYILEAMGVKAGAVDPHGALAYKSYTEIAEDICKALLEKGFQVSPAQAAVRLERLFNENVTQHHREYRLFTDMDKLMKELKARNIVIGLATADTMISAESCLEAIGIRSFFDYVGADDGKRRPKPDREMFLEFMDTFALQPEEIAVVGDTCNDMLFAGENGGVAIGVLSGVSEEKDFKNKADHVIASIHELTGLLDRI